MEVIMNYFLNEDSTKFVGGWIGDWLDNAGAALKDNAFELAMSALAWVGNLLLYVSMTLIAVGVYCLIFKYKKPLKVGFIGFLISIILIVLGGE
ncbi:MAG: hypothetical protein LLF83_06520 [Methanobacterium sp.]|nr:hypothetical protein [Methanobacterium sp.]